MQIRYQPVRHWLAAAGAVALAVVLLPPVGSVAQHYVIAEAVQFAVLAVVVPALLVLGAPWRLLGFSLGRVSGAGLIDRFATARSHQRSAWRPWTWLLGYIAALVTWRLPVTVNALGRHEALILVEAITLIPLGCALWLELVSSPPLLPRIGRPLRAAFAALPMWVIWASAYIMGFSRATWFTSYAHVPGHGLSTVADQQIAAFLLWAIPGLCFVPIVYVSLMTWLRDSSDPDEELQDIRRAASETGPGKPRPPRGWRLPTA